MHARSGSEALEKALTLHPNAITLDVILSSTDGWDVLRSLKKDPRLAPIPVVVVSILDEPSMAHALGAADYFVKPVDRKRLIATLDRLVANDRKARVLAVDDDPKALELFESVLAREGYEVTSAQGGQEALHLAQTSPFDLVLLDLMMPDMNGFDALSALRADPKTASLPVVVVTAHELTPEDKRFLSDKVHYVLQKGRYGRSDLLAWLERATARSKEGRT